MFKFINEIKKIKEEKEKFDMFIAENKAFNKKMHDEMINVLCENAYTMGMARIEIDFEKDLYKNMTDLERLRIMTAHTQGKLEYRMESGK
ncbi:hypothetical protein PBV87_08065 [Niameybacter massiliensis]|uniref:Uncharacterized protein n=1 Tax=Holtiella tumoricola TaxID=3018743 RepID=A0AA42DLM3_9FIRM|nr:hypothetical protein [Holtiella tumoricola]MDA3731430.1 hypothetical protein [Holtiella tumoricola]